MYYPQNKLENPTDIPVQKSAYPQNITSSVYPPFYNGYMAYIFPWSMMAMITPYIATASQKITLI